MIGDQSVFQMSMFDVFLSYSSSDRAAVEVLARRLRSEAGLEPFLDRWHLIPGERWQPALERALEESKSAAVFIGPSGISPWHNEEMRAALVTAVRTKDEYRVIPVLLPGAEEKALPGFLAQRTWVDFRAGLDQEEAFQRLVTGIRGVPRPVETFCLPDEPAPYRGLSPFQREHANRYFGRDREIASVLETLQRSSFAVIAGVPGAGKTSLVLAGLLPRLEPLAPASAPLKTLFLTPGANPLRSIAEAVATLLPTENRRKGADELVERMRCRPDGLCTAISAWTADRPASPVLVIDQLEELFTQAAGPGPSEQAEAFAANLRHAVLSKPASLRVLATIRADFIDRCLEIEPLRDLLQDRTVLLERMTPEGMHDAIVRPASSVGAMFESGVISAVLREVERQSVTLPLLEHALDLLWRQRSGVWLTAAAYESIGGVTGALARHADEVFRSLSSEDQVVARDIFLRLVTPGENARDTMRRVVREELDILGSNPEQVDRILRAFSNREARLLVADLEPHRKAASIEMAHEILLREWPALREWVDNSRHLLGTHRRLTESARDWHAHGRDSSYLLTGARLSEAEVSFGANCGGLNQLEADFLAASLDARSRQARLEDERWRELAGVQLLAETQLARARILWRSLAALCAVALLAILFGLFALTSRSQEAVRSTSARPASAALHRHGLRPEHRVPGSEDDSVSSTSFSLDGRRFVAASYGGPALVRSD